MKALIWVFSFALLAMAPLWATDYYSRTTQYLNSRFAWTTNRDETGQTPPDFTSSNQVFHVQNGHNKTASAAWTVSGTNSKVVIETGGQITTGSFNHNIDLDMQSGATYEMTDTSYSFLDALSWDAGSTFIVNRSSASFQDDLPYGNLILRSANAAVTGSSGLTVQGTLTIEYGSSFVGGTTTGHSNSFANLVMTGGYFYGSGGSGAISYNISGGISLSGSSYFYGSDGAGSVTYNIGGNVSVGSSSWFNACYRSSSGDLPSVTYNIGGSFTCDGSYYYARNRSEGGSPTFYFSGVGKSLGFGPASSTASCQHNIYVNSGASYSLTRDLYGGQYAYLRINGTLNGANYQIKNYGGYDPSLHIYGRFYTERATGLVGNSTDAVAFSSPAYLYLYSGSHIYYSSSSAQTISSLSGYDYVTLSGGGTKTLSNSCTVQTELNVNSPLVISTNKTLQLNGRINSTSSINGGNIYVGGSSSQLNLPQATIGQLTVNRANGCALAGVVMVTTIVLNNGTLAIGNRTLRILGAIYHSGGSISGGSSAILSVEGTADMFSMYDLVLHTLSLNRANGLYLHGTVTVSDLYLTNGTFNIASGTLQLSGNIYTTSGQLSGGTTSTLSVYGIGDITLPALTLGTMAASRTGTVYMGGNLSTNTLNISSGNFSISTRTLTINTRLTGSGNLLGHYGSSLVYNGSGYALSLPAINLNSFTLNSSAGCTLLGNLNLVYLTLSSGNLNLASNTLLVQGGISFSSGTISGNSTSILSLDISSATVSLPQFSIGSLVIDGPATYSCTGSSLVYAKLQLLAGSLSPAGYLTLSSGGTIERSGGALNAAPSFSGTINVVYNANCDAGPEIPSGTNVLTSLKINSGFTVSSDLDIYLNSSLTLGNNAILNMDEGSIDMPSSCTVNSGSGALVLGPVQTSLSGSGFTLLPGGIGIGSGVEILSFSSSQSTTPQELQNGQSVSRSWDLSGSFSGTVSLTFTWDSSADNGLGFSSSNRACVMRYNGSSWVQVGDPVDVSGSNPRSITVQTTGFSEWTVGSEDTTLPVTLSSFTAIPNQLNYVQIAWITQSESNLTGFRLLRGHADNLVNAQDLGVLISATNTSSQQFYSYVDSEVTAPASYFYWLAALEMDGSVTYSHSAQVILQDLGEPNVAPPIDLPLMSVYPNPFNPVQTLRIAHRLDGELEVLIYNNRGQKVRQLRSGYLAKGLYSLEWDGLDEMGSSCASGNYLIHCHTAYEDKWIRSCLLK